MLTHLSSFAITMSSIYKFSKQLTLALYKHSKNLSKTHTFGTTSVVKPSLKHSEIAHSVIRRPTTERDACIQCLHTR